MKLSPALFALPPFLPRFSRGRQAGAPGSRRASFGRLKDLDGYFSIHFRLVARGLGEGERGDDLRIANSASAIGLGRSPRHTGTRSSTGGSSARIHGREQVFRVDGPATIVTAPLYRPANGRAASPRCSSHDIGRRSDWMVRGEAEMKKELASRGRTARGRWDAAFSIARRANSRAWACRFQLDISATAPRSRSSRGRAKLRRRLNDQKPGEHINPTTASGCAGRDTGLDSGPQDFNRFHLMASQTSPSMSDST